ncbi:MAG: protein phosphatase 2C domain-containing protein [Lachnospiraceae bacterium]|nr:protein phosphatase 2C domain-containing protein [Lachnospiraceae bacterium]
MKNSSTFTAYAFSHIGNSRDNQEDNFLLGDVFLTSAQVQAQSDSREMTVTAERLSEDRFCMAISDGMGGYEGGEVASGQTVKYMAEHMAELYDSAIAGKNGLNDFVKKLNFFICEKAGQKEQLNEMGATLCALVSSRGRTYSVNAGDSRLYLYSDGVLEHITTDDTEGQRLIGLGLLSPDEEKTFPDRKKLYKYLGRPVELMPDVREVNTLRSGDIVMLCSDGLYDVTDDEEIADMLSKKNLSIAEKGRFLTEMAVERNEGAGDNVTLVIAEY